MSAFKEALQQDLDKSRQAEIETLLAKAFFLSSQYDSVTFYGQKVISYCQEQDLSDVRIQRLLMENYNILGNKFGRVSDNSQVIHYYLEAFEHCKRSDKQRSLPDICTNIADTYIRTGRPQGRVGAAADGRAGAVPAGADGVGPEQSRAPPAGRRGHPGEVP